MIETDSLRHDERCTFKQARYLAEKCYLDIDPQGLSTEILASAEALKSHFETTRYYDDRYEIRRLIANVMIPCLAFNGELAPDVPSFMKESRVDE